MNIRVCDFVAFADSAPAVTTDFHVIGNCKTLFAGMAPRPFGRGILRQACPSTPIFAKNRRKNGGTRLRVRSFAIGSVVMSRRISYCADIHEKYKCSGRYNGQIS